MKYNNHNIQLFILTIILAVGFNINQSQAQISINNSNVAPDASAMLDVSSSEKGLLAPRMSSEERESINSPATGLLVYDTDENAFFYYNGTSWESIRNQYYQFGNNQSDETTECQKIVPDDAEAEEQFGTAIGLSGNYALIGAANDNNNTGEVHVFEYSEDTWASQSILTASDGAAGDLFGTAILMTETHAFIGAYGTNINQGAVYVFERSANTWTEIDKLEANDGETNNLFGTSLAISGDYLLIGATSGHGDQGAAYVFQESNGVWTQQSKLVASDGTNGNLFGQSVAIAEDKLVIGSPLADAGAGAAYVFEYDLSLETWTEQQKFTGEPIAFFGYAVEMANDQIIVSAPNDGTGTVYIYEHNGINWEEQEQLTAWRETTNNTYGEQIAITDTKMIITASRFEMGNNDSGVTYLYDYSNGEWQLETKFIPADPSFDPKMGTAVALSDDFALVGAAADNQNGTSAGAVYTYCTQLNDLLDNTDDQEIALDGYNLSTENGNTVDLSTALDDDQTINRLDRNGNNIRLSLQDDGDGNKTVDLSGYLDNTDQQELSLTDNTLAITDGGSVDLSDFKDLGTHTATATINTNLQKISGDGNDEGMSIDADGNLTIAATALTSAINFVPPSNNENTRIHFNDETGNSIWNIGAMTSEGSFTFEDAANNTQPFVIEADAADNALTISPAGNVGIGIDGATNAKFEVNGHLNNVINNYTFLSNINSSFVHVTNNTEEKEVSIFATERIVGKFVISMSDERIKTVQGISNSQEDLATLRQIEITDYQYKDKVKEGNTQQKKVIAQQVDEVYPQAVNKQFTQVVPDIYQTAIMNKQGWINLTNDLKIGEKVKILFADSEEVLEVLETTSTSFRVVPSTVRRLPSTVFIYGRQVNDFHTVDYDAIAMLNVSATQQLAKENELLQKIAAEQERQIEVLEERMARLRALEVAVGEEQ